MKSSKKPLLLIGGGGHCVSCIDVIEQAGEYEIVGILDTQDKVGTQLLGYKFIGTDADLKSLVQKYKNAFVTVGQTRSNDLRKSLVQKLLQLDAYIPTIISPRSYISSHAQIGRGSLFMHDVVVNAQARIGDFCILNTKSLIEHDCEVGEFTHIATGAILNGAVQVGKNCFIGSQTTVIQSVHIGDDVVLGAGITIKKNIPSGLLIKANYE